MKARVAAPALFLRNIRVCQRILRSSPSSGGACGGRLSMQSGDGGEEGRGRAKERRKRRKGDDGRSLLF